MKSQPFPAVILYPPTLVIAVEQVPSTLASHTAEAAPLGTVMVTPPPMLETTCTPAVEELQSTVVSEAAQESTGQKTTAISN